MPHQYIDLKNSLFLLCFLFATNIASAQTETTTVVISDSGKTTLKKIKKPITDTSQFFRDTFKTANTASDTNDTLVNAVDNTVEPNINIVFHDTIDTFYQKLLNNPFFQSNKPPLYLVIDERKETSKDELFYLLSFLLIALAIIKVFFNRFFVNVFKLLFQPSFRQKQTKEQLMQGNAPSFFMNIFFILSGGAFIALLSIYYHLSSVGFQSLYLYSMAALLILYSGKYIILQFAAWVFNVKDAIDNYVFVVYLINKIIGVLLIPCILVMAFSSKQLVDVSVVVAFIIISVLFMYRYIISFAPVKKEIKVSIPHFFIYIIAVEFLPLLLISKMLIIYLNNSH